MFMVGGDPQGIAAGGELLRRCAVDIGARSAGFDLVRMQGSPGCGETPSGAAAALARCASAYGALADDLGREIDALGLLASSTAHDLRLAGAASSVRGLLGRLG